MMEKGSRESLLQEASKENIVAVAIYSRILEVVP